MKKKTYMMHACLGEKCCQKSRVIIEPHREKTRFLPMQKQRRKSAVSNCTADQRLCFRYTDSTIPLPLKTEISSFYPASVNVQVGLYQTGRKPRFSRVAAQLKLED